MDKIKLIYDIPGHSWYDEEVNAEDCESMYDLAVQCGYTDVHLTSSFTRLANCITEYLMDRNWNYKTVYEKYCDRMLKVFKDDNVVTLITSKYDLYIGIAKGSKLLYDYVTEVSPIDNDDLETRAHILVVDLIYGII